jgi:prolyl oligopeptidase
MTPDADPHIWLEDVAGDQPLAWVRRQNERTDAAYGEGVGFRRLEEDLRAILDSDDKIPFVRKVGQHYYNFWQDAAHERGLWRRTTPASYESAEPEWETVLDLDALSEAEG